jgi:hypothetical protein
MSVDVFDFQDRGEASAAAFSGSPRGFSSVRNNRLDLIGRTSPEAPALTTSMNATH